MGTSYGVCCCISFMNQRSSQELACIAVSKFIFQRFAVPAVMNPKLFYLHNQHANIRVSRTLTLCAKVPIIILFTFKISLHLLNISRLIALLVNLVLTRTKREHALLARQVSKLTMALQINCTCSTICCNVNLLKCQFVARISLPATV